VEKTSIEMKPEVYCQMCLIRAFEQALHHLNKAGLVCGTAHLYIGMEAIAVGACAAMKDKDLLTSTHRGHGHCLARGLDAGRMMAEILGRVDGYCGGKGAVCILPISPTEISELTESLEGVSRSPSAQPWADG
jgi:acetoin:2,6-dichlorophenolindophenol oxidoreductase subunit alpha